MINEQTIAKMKDGVIIINAARGALIDTSALIDALKSEKIRGVALDTYEHEAGIFFYDHSEKILQDDLLARLLQFSNVIITPHCAFYTETAVQNIIETVLLNLQGFEEKDSSPNQII